MSAIDGALALWFILTLAALLFVGYDALRHQPIAGVMKWGWIAVTAYTGPIGLVVYLLSCREPLPRTHERFVAPLWKQAVGSTIHCLAGDATGIIAAAALIGPLGLPMRLDLLIEYAVGFAFGLLIFQALFMKLMVGGSYWGAVGRTLLPEWLSMNAVMAGMVVVMVPLMSGGFATREPSNPRFWGVMALATLVGALLAYPVNVWLVARGLKHGMGTIRVLGHGGEGMGDMEGPPQPRTTEIALVSAATIVLLFAAIWIASSLGDLG